MTLPTHNQLMLAEIAASKALSPEHIASEREKAANLMAAGFTTQAFLHLWIVTEVAVKELIRIYKYTKDAHEILKKMQSELKRALKRHLVARPKETAHEQASILTNMALPSLSNSLYGVLKNHAESRQLDVAAIKSALTVLEITVDSAWFEYLLATKIEELPECIDFSEKTTVRERRNKLVHSNGSVSDATLVRLLPLFDYFLTCFRV
ncbi:hypothetical protein [Aeromonas sp. QDB05]|uniref:hypothetical protein n=1 Tax=Aeromonas sp. QDB05 TaxID=2990478 RepID=UPI0022E043B5|nr:hypothetical protein [Aeromonas sp. QDB05]